jgi:hypothetical protein
MAYERSLHGVIPGLLLLALLWATWAGYPWLGMDARASGNGSLETGSQAIRCIAWRKWFVTVRHEWSWQGWLGCWRGR